MDGKNLYYIKIKGTQYPLLMSGDVALIYDDKAMAESFARKKEQSYFYSALEVVQIHNEAMFFSGMTTLNITKFLLNGKGKLLSASDFGCTETVNMASGAVDSYEKLKKAQPTPIKPAKREKGRNDSVVMVVFGIICVAVIILGIVFSDEKTSSSGKKKKSSHYNRDSYKNSEYYKEWQDLERNNDELRKNAEEALKNYETSEIYGKYAGELPNP